MIRDNESIYDEQIAPLMSQIIAICKRHEIPMAATFEYAPGDFCSTAIGQTGQSVSIGKVITAVIALSRGPSPLQITTTSADGSKVIEVILP